MPGPSDSLRFYNTTYKPSEDTIFRGEEKPIAQLNFTDFLAVETSHSLPNQFSILLPDTWCTQDYLSFFNGPTRRSRLTVDRALVQDLQSWYQAITLNLQDRFPKISPSDLSNTATQILEQITFIRFIEDHKLTNSNTLSNLVSSFRGVQFLHHFQELVSLYGAIFGITLFEPVEVMPSPSVLRTIVTKITELYKFELLKLDLLGSVFEQFLMTHVESSRKDVFYIPEYVVDYLVGRAFYAFEKANQRKVTSVLDPSCGTGTLLLNAFQKLLQEHNELNFSQKCQLLETSVFGIDSNHLAIRYTARMLYFTLLSSAVQEKRKLPLPELIGHNLLVKDALVDRRQLIPDKGLAAKSTKFDVIVNNPPYLRIKGEKLARHFRMAQYQSLYADVALRTVDANWLMLIASLDNLKEGGILSLVVPDAILFSQNTLLVRKYILERACILEIAYLNRKALLGGAVPLVILLLQRNSSEQARHSNMIQVNYYSTPGVFNREASDETPQANFYEEKLNYVFNVRLTSSIKAVYDRIKSQSQQLDNCFEYSLGIVLGKGRVLQDTPISLKSKKYISGKDIQPYMVNWKGTYIDYDLKIVRCPRRPDMFEHSPKLIIRRVMKDRFIVAIDFEQYYVSDHAYVLIPKIDLPSDFMFLSLAMFSSRLASFCYRVENPGLTTSFSRLHTINIQKLPLPSPELHENKMLIDSIAKEAKSLYDQVQTGAIMGYAVYQTSRMQKIDSLFAQLYGLTEGENNLIDTYLG